MVSPPEDEEAPPDTERERPLFRTMTLKVPRDRGVGPLIAAMQEIDGYAVHEVKRKGEEALVILKRIDR